MSAPEVLKAVVEAEKEAERIIQVAERKSSELKGQLQERIAATRRDILENARKQRESMLEAARRRGEREAVDYALNAEEDLKALVERARARKDKAVAKVLELVLSWMG